MTKNTIAVEFTEKEYNGYASLLTSVTRVGNKHEVLERMKSIGQMENLNAFIDKISKPAHAAKWCKDPNCDEA